MAAHGEQNPMLIARVQENSRNDGELEEKPTLSLEVVQREILIVSKRKEVLLKDLERYEAELKSRRAKTARLREKFKNCIKVPQVDINFEQLHGKEGGDLIREVFTISQKPSMCITGGHVLITFEEENVASRIQEICEFHVSCDCGTLTVKPRKINLHALNFELHLDIFKRKIEALNVIPSNKDKEVKDRLEMSFSKPSKGGGEVKRVEYDVALSLAQAGTFQVDLETEKMVEVAPVFQHRLHRFQNFCASPRRTVLMSGIKDLNDEETLQDFLEVYFQKPSHSGGEITHIRYISKKSLQAFFSCDDVAVVDNTSGI